MSKPRKFFWGNECRPYPNDFYDADEMDEYLATKDARIALMNEQLTDIAIASIDRIDQIDQLAADVKDGRVLAEFKQHQIDRLRKVIEDLDFDAEGRLQGVVDFQALRIAWLKRSLKDRDAAIAELSADLI